MNTPEAFHEAVIQARLESLTKRVAELEAENNNLRKRGGYTAADMQNHRQHGVAELKARRSVWDENVNAAGQVVELYHGGKLLKFFPSLEDACDFVALPMNEGARFFAEIWEVKTATLLHSEHLPRRTST